MLTNEMACVRTNESSVNICSINICGLSSRSNHMIDKYNCTQKFDIITMQETGTDITDRLNISNMKVIADTNQSKNRGAAVYVKSDYSCTKLPEISKLSKHIDSAWCLTIINNKRYIIGSIYVKLNTHCAIQETIKMLKAAQTMTYKLKAYGVILAGDFNARHPMWGDEISNEYGKQLVESLDNTAFSIVTSNSPTFLCENGSSHIDLMIISKNLASKVNKSVTDEDIELFSGAPLRGHVPLITEIVSRSNATKTPVTEKLDVNSIDWASWTEDLEEQLLRDQREIHRYEDPARLWKYIEESIQNITNKHGVFKKTTRHSKPYWSDRLTVLCNKMRSARKNYNKRNTDNNKQNMIKAKEEFDKERKAECEKFLLDKTKTLNSTEASKFWKEFNKIFKTKTEEGVDPLDDGNGGLMTENKEKEVKLFGTFFQCRHMTNADFDEYFHDSVNDLYEGIMSENIYNIVYDDEQQELNSPISDAEIKKAIKNTDANKISLDNHQMHPKMLHHLGDRAIRLIKRLFNISMNKSKWVWNQAEVIFLKKDGKDTYSVPGSYRPISITSYIGKLLEKIIAARIVRYLFKKGYYDPDQEGFTAGKNTNRYLNRLNLEIKTDLLDMKTVIGLFVDMEKAFDSVWKKGLIVKLGKLKIKGKVLKLINNFLTSRMVKLNVNGYKGEERDCEEYGLPQGSALSPVLFKIYVMDILDELKENSDISLFKFADDGTIKISSESTEKCVQELNKVISSLEQWTRKWRMIINCNKNKTEYLCFGTAENNADIPNSIQLADKTIKRVDKTKVLGLTIDEKLSYIPHSKEVHRTLINRWVRICQYSNIHWGFNQRVLSQLINTLFIPSLQYAGHIWIHSRNLADINQIWNKLIKSAVGSTFNIKTSIGEVILGIPPITIQTGINRIKHFLKLNIKKMPEDNMRKYVSACADMKISQPVELKNAMKEVFKFLKWKLSVKPGDFSEEDERVVNRTEENHYFELSSKSCSYTKSLIKKYTEKIWYDKLTNQGLSEGDAHIPRPSCTKLPVPQNTPRQDEVLLMSMFYPQNLLDSFTYRHTYGTESPLCPRCNREEQTPFHVIYECNNHTDEIQKIITDIVDHNEVQQGDSTTLLNCSRSEKFLKTCLKVLSEGEFRHHIEIN